MLKEATISERKIVNAFIELLEESSLEQISITDIIKKANLSRPTFYYYYSNKEDLVETTFSKILDKVSSILQEDMTYQEGVVTEMLRYLKENQKLCLTLMTHIPNINEMIREFIIETILNSDIENVTELMEQSYHIPAKYSLEIYVSTIVTILTLWLKEGCVESPEELADIILEAVIIKVNKLGPLRPSLFLLNVKIKTIKSSKVIIHRLCTADHTSRSIFLVENFCRTKASIIVVTH